MHIFYLFRYITIYWSPLFALFTRPVSFEALARGLFLEPRKWELVSKIRVPRLPGGENCAIL